MEIVISPEIRLKLKEKHDVTSGEVEECFYNRTGKFLEDSRPEHKTIPPTLWFVGQTNKRRKLKIVFVLADHIYIKSAYDANDEVITRYKKNAKP